MHFTVILSASVYYLFRPYYEALEGMVNAQSECQKAAVQFQRAAGWIFSLSFRLRAVAFSSTWTLWDIHSWKSRWQTDWYVPPPVWQQPYKILFWLFGLIRADWFLYCPSKNAMANSCLLEQWTAIIMSIRSIKHSLYACDWQLDNMCTKLLFVKVILG